MALQPIESDASPNTRTVFEMFSIGDKIRTEGRHFYSLGAGSPPVVEALAPFSEHLSEALVRASKNHTGEIFAYPFPQGSAELRELLASRSNESVQYPRYTADRILLTNGGQQALSILANTFPQPVVLAPEITYLGAIGAFKRAKKITVGVRQDADGMLPDVLRDRIRQIRAAKSEPAFIYTNPTHTNPTGEIMPMDRKKEIYAVASETGVRIIEDDPYNHTSFPGYEDMVSPSIASLENDRDPAEKLVIRVDSFSKILAPGIRTGWIAVDDPRLLTEIAMTRSDLDFANNAVVQQFLTNILTMSDKGSLVTESILNNYKQISARKKQIMSRQLERYGIHTYLKLNEPTGGMFFYGTSNFPGIISATSVRERLHKMDSEIVTSVACSSPANEFNDQANDDGLRINFTGIADSDMPVAIAKLEKALSEELHDN